MKNNVSGPQVKTGAHSLKCYNNQVSEKLQKAIARDNSRSADIRARQNDAAKASKPSKPTTEKSSSITDQNVDAFIKEAQKNGLDLVAIAAAVAAEKAAETEED